MKKATLSAIANYLFENVQYANDVEKEFLTNALAELNAEINRGAEAKAAKGAEYDAARAVVMAELANTVSPVTIGELFEAVKDKLPSGFTKGKLQYGITQLWGDVIDHSEDSPRAYFLR